MANSKPLVVFNWKENPRTLRAALRLFGALIRAIKGKGGGRATIVACPPIVHLEELSRKSAASHAHLSLGAQDVFWKDAGAYTGNVGPAMLRDAGKNIRYVIVGHSERRRIFHETDEVVNKKVRAALGAGLHTILCVGEPAAVRGKGIRVARQYVKNQLKKDLKGIRIHESGFMDHLIIAYEPIWAIGTGKNDPPEGARDMAAFIKKETHGAPVLYGGSVTGANIADYLCYHEMNGVLVGGASLRAEEIKKIINNIP